MIAGGPAAHNNRIPGERKIGSAPCKRQCAAWPGNLKLPTRGSAAASGGKVVKEGPDPQVDLLLDGKGRARRVSAARIEFQNKPVYVGILEHKGIWHD